MIVMIACFNDGAILSIAYDNVHSGTSPESWNMRSYRHFHRLGVIGSWLAFGLFYMGNVFSSGSRPHSNPHVFETLYCRTLEIFLTRTRGPSGRFALRNPVDSGGWHTGGRDPHRGLWVFMTPLGLKWAGFVWAYALTWALVNDRVKLLAYRILDPVKAKTPSISTSEVAQAQPVETSSELKPQIAKRAYELYEQEGHEAGHADQDWLKAEQEIQKAKSHKA